MTKTNRFTKIDAKGKPLAASGYADWNGRDDGAFVRPVRVAREVQNP